MRVTKGDSRGGPPASGPVIVWLYGDVSCPWSCLAYARIRSLSGELPVQLGWRPLPAAWPTDVPAASEFVGLEIPAPVRRPRFEGTDALVAVEFSRDLGGDAMDRTLGGLFTSNFAATGEDVGREALLGACERLGLDRLGLENAFQDGRYEPELERAAQEADRYRIDQVPTMLVGSMKLVGAAPLAILAQVVRRQLGAAGS